MLAVRRGGGSHDTPASLAHPSRGGWTLDSDPTPIPLWIGVFSATIV